MSTVSSVFDSRQSSNISIHGSRWLSNTHTFFGVKVSLINCEDKLARKSLPGSTGSRIDYTVMRYWLHTPSMSFPPTFYSAIPQLDSSLPSLVDFFERLKTILRFRYGKMMTKSRFVSPLPVDFIFDHLDNNLFVSFFLCFVAAG